MDTNTNYFRTNKQAYQKEVLQLYDSNLAKVLHKMLPLYVVEIAIEEAILQWKSHRIPHFLNPIRNDFMDVNELLTWSDTRQRQQGIRQPRD